MEIVRLKATDYEEWLSVLKTVFSRRDKKDVDFRKELPKMCVKDDYHMGMHLAIKDEGKICALLGVYPIRTKIGEKELLFSTVGNVATLPEYEGKGYMRILMGEAMKELERIGADASRLGGVRQRYNRYGFEACGIEHSFIIDDYTTKYCFNASEKLFFKEISLNDKNELMYINEIRKNEPIHVLRSIDDSFFGDYTSLCAWKNKPYIALDNNKNMFGYVSVSEDKKTIAEVVGTDADTLKKILFSWQMDVNNSIKFSIPTANFETVKYFSKVSEEMFVFSPCHFKIINFDKVADALVKLKASYIPNLPNGEKVIGIKEWGNLLIYNNNGNAFCEKTDKEPDIILDKLEASRFLFGPFDVNTVTYTDEFLSLLLPLPLSWSTLDRV